MPCRFFLLALYLLLALDTNAQLDTAGLIAHWTFDSTKADVTGNGHNIVTAYKYQSGTPPSVYVSGANGSNNTALQFYSNTISATYYSNMLALDSNFSITALLRFDTLSPAIILEKRGTISINDQYNAYGLSAGHLGQSFGFIPESDINLVANYYVKTQHLPYYYTPGINTSEWSFVVMTYDNKYFKIYHNGSLKSAIYSPDADFTSGNQGLYIGGTYNVWYIQYYLPFMGAMDDLRLYNRALPDSEIVTYPFEFFDTTVVWNMPASDSVICSGNKFDAKYLTSKNFRSTNTFTIQLSDTNGNFNNPITIGSATSNTSGTINCTIPTSVGSGNYLVRIIATAPVDTSYEFSINYKPSKHVNGQLRGYTVTSASYNNAAGRYCEGDSVIFTVDSLKGVGTFPSAFQWQINSKNILGATAPEYSTDSLQNNDTIACVVSSGHQCWYGAKDTFATVVGVD